jgi:hypothetical protein
VPTNSLQVMGLISDEDRLVFLDLIHRYGRCFVMDNDLHDKGLKDVAPEAKRYLKENKLWGIGGKLLLNFDTLLAAHNHTDRELQRTSAILRQWLKFHFSKYGFEEIAFYLIYLVKSGSISPPRKKNTGVTVEKYFRDLAAQFGWKPGNGNSIKKCYYIYLDNQKERLIHKEWIEAAIQILELKPVRGDGPALKLARNELSA